MGVTMDPNSLIQAIGSVGFPIVACCALFYLYDKTISKLTSTLEKVDSTNERIATAIDKIFDRLEKMENKLDAKEDDGK